LPDALNPLAAIRQIVIADVDTTAAGTLIPLGTSNVVNVASANLGQPTFATYLVSRPMNLTGTDPDATGALRIKANNKSANLNLSIAGLVPGATSYLWSNGNFWLEGTNDARGQVVFATTFTVPEALAIRTLAVSDANTNLVLTTTIP
jgi:hypothetical protein